MKTKVINVEIRTKGKNKAILFTREGTYKVKEYERSPIYSALLMKKLMHHFTSLSSSVVFYDRKK